jgi:hypothetical protein
VLKFKRKFRRQMVKVKTAKKMKEFNVENENRAIDEV